MNSLNLTLLTDLYELTMMQGYFERHKIFRHPYKPLSSYSKRHPPSQAFPCHAFPCRAFVSFVSPLSYNKSPS